jgi:hypothetical protein
MQNLTPLVHHLLSRRHQLPQRAIISCLALAQLDPQPTRRVPTTELMQVLDVLQHPHLSKLLRELKITDLVDYESGTVPEPGYLFWRVGPADFERGRPAKRRRHRGHQLTRLRLEVAA